MSGPDPGSEGENDGLDDGREWNDPPGVGEAAAPVEPGRPSAENVAFVLLGVVLALYVVARLAGLV